MKASDRLRYRALDELLAKAANLVNSRPTMAGADLMRAEADLMERIERHIWHLDDRKLAEWCELLATLADLKGEYLSIQFPKSGMAETMRSALAHIVRTVLTIRGIDPVKAGASS